MVQEISHRESKKTVSKKLRQAFNRRRQKNKPQNLKHKIEKILQIAITETD